MKCFYVENVIIQSNNFQNKSGEGTWRNGPAGTNGTTKLCLNLFSRTSFFLFDSKVNSHVPAFAEFYLRDKIQKNVKKQTVN